MRRVLLSCGGGCKIHLLDVNTGEICSSLAHTHKLWHAAQVTETEFCCTGWDQGVSVWDVKEPSMIRSVSGHAGFTRDLVYDQVTSCLFSTSFDETVRVWNPHNEYECVATLSPPPRDDDQVAATGYRLPVNSVTTLPQTSPGQVFAGSSRIIRCFDVEKEVLLRTLQDSHHAMVQTLSHDDSKGLLLSGAEDERVCIWDARSQSFECVNHIRQRSFVSTLFYWPSKQVIVVGTGDGAVALWDLRKVASDTPLFSFIAAKEAVWDAVELGDGERIAVVSSDCSTSVFGTSTGKRVWTTEFEGRQYGICMLGWQPKLHVSLTGSMMNVETQPQVVLKNPLLAFLSEADEKLQEEKEQAQQKQQEEQEEETSDVATSRHQRQRRIQHQRQAHRRSGSFSPSASTRFTPVPSDLTLFKVMRGQIIEIRLLRKTIHTYKLFLCESTNSALRNLHQATYLQIPLDLPHAYSDVIHLILTENDTSAIQSNEWLIDYFMLFMALGHQRRAFLVAKELGVVRDVAELWKIAETAVLRLGKGYRSASNRLIADMQIVEEGEEEGEGERVQAVFSPTIACAFTGCVFDCLKKKITELGEEEVCSAAPSDYLKSLLLRHTNDIQGNEFQCKHSDFRFGPFGVPKSFAGRTFSLFKTLMKFNPCPPNIILRSKLDKSMFPAHLEIVVSNSHVFGTAILLGDLTHLAASGEIWVRRLLGNAIRSLVEYAYSRKISTHDITALIQLWIHTRSLSEGMERLKELVETRLMEVCRDLLQVRQLEDALSSIAQFLKEETVRMEANKFFVEPSLFGGMPFPKYLLIVEGVLSKQKAMQQQRDLGVLQQEVVGLQLQNRGLRTEMEVMRREMNGLRSQMMGLLASAAREREEGEEEQEVEL